MKARALPTIDHVAVTAPQHLETAVIAFYSETLGLERVPKPAGTRGAGAWFRAGEAQVHVTIEAEHQAAGHFGLAVDDLGTAVDSVRGAGFPIEPASPIPGRSRCYTRDPAGNVVELLSYEEDPGA